MTRFFRLALLILASAFVAPVAQAGTYYIEAAVIKNNGQGKGELFTDESGSVTASGVVPDRTSVSGGYISEEKLRSHNYPVLAHVSWNQAAQPQSAALPRIISGLDAAGDSLTGDIKFFDRHYLFIDVELQLTDPETRQRYTIKEKRRVRPDEMHYFDHPKFGVILYLKRTS